MTMLWVLGLIAGILLLVGIIRFGFFKLLLYIGLSLGLILGLSLPLTSLVRKKDARNATRYATMAVYAVQDAYLRLCAALPRALDDEQAFSAALELEAVLGDVFTMMAVYSKGRKLPDTYSHYSNRFRSHGIESQLPLFIGDNMAAWEHAPAEVFAEMQASFSQPLDQLAARGPGRTRVAKKSDVFWIPYYIQHRDFLNHPDRARVEGRLLELRGVYGDATNRLNQVKEVVSRRSDPQLWRPFLDRVSDYMKAGKIPAPLSGIPSSPDSCKWTAWDISHTNHYRCLVSFLPWKDRASDPESDARFILVYRRSSEYVGYYVPADMGPMSGIKPKNSDAYVESAHVVVGRVNPFEVHAVHVLQSENPPQTLRTAGGGAQGYYAQVDDRELKKLIDDIRGTKPSGPLNKN